MQKECDEAGTKFWLGQSHNSKMSLVSLLGFFFCVTWFLMVFPMKKEAT